MQDMTKSMIDLSSQVAIVTGGTRGLGRDIAAGLAQSGCMVWICGRNVPDSVPDGVRFEACDIRDAEQAKAFADKVAAFSGRIDILVNNAGGSPPHDAATASPRFAEALVRLNLLGPLYMAQSVYPYMARAGRGSIVNIASVSGARPSPGTSIYGAAKAGLLNLTQAGVLSKTTFSFTFHSTDLGGDFRADINLPPGTLPQWTYADGSIRFGYSLYPGQGSVGSLTNLINGSVTPLEVFFLELAVE